MECLGHVIAATAAMIGNPFAEVWELGRSWSVWAPPHLKPPLTLSQATGMGMRVTGQTPSCVGFGLDHSLHTLSYPHPHVCQATVRSH